MQRTPALTLLASAIAVLLAACTTSTPAPVVDRTARPVTSAPPPPRPVPAVAPRQRNHPRRDEAGSQFYVVQKGTHCMALLAPTTLIPTHWLHGTACRRAAVCATARCCG